MIISLTPNPAVDQTLWVPEVQLGTVNRFGETQLDPAGKGINVSRMVRRLGRPTVAFGFIGGETGRIVEQALHEEHVQHHFLQVAGRTRISTTIIEKTRATNFYGPGPVVTPQDLAELEVLLRFWFQAARVFVIAGSLPEGMSAEAAAALVGCARGCGVKVVADLAGPALRAAVQAKADLIKPNAREAGELVGREVADTAGAVAAARELMRMGAGAVVLSMGARGAVCVQGGRAWVAVPPRVERRTTVGAGDSMVAGLAIAMARGESLAEGLRLGTAAGAATTTSSGTSLGSAADVRALLPRVELRELPESGAP